MSDMSYTGTDNLEVMREAVNYNRFLIDLVKNRARADDHLLDFGAGVGTFAVALAHAGHRVACVEPDPTQRATIAGYGLSAHASLASVGDETIDFAYTFNVLEHIDDDRGALADLARTVRRGGKLLVYVPAFDVLYTSMDRKVGHVRRYRVRELERKVESVGLRVRQAEYVDSLGFLATLAYKALGSDTGELNRSALRAYDRFVFPMSRVADVAAKRLFGKNVLVVAAKE